MTHELRTGFEMGALSAWILGAISSAIPVYTGNNYFLKWLYRLFSLIGTKFERFKPPKANGG